MKTKLLILTALLALPALVSCSDSKDNSGTGVAGNTLLKDIAGSDDARVCRWFVDEYWALLDDVGIRQQCTFLMAHSADNKSECTMDVNDCVEDFEDESSADDAEECAGWELPEIASGCKSVTIADYESCVKELVAGAKKLIQKSSCDVTGVENDYEQVARGVSKRCRLIIDECPAVLPGFVRDVEGEDASDDP